MKVSNLRGVIDPDTYEPSVIVDVKVSTQHLYNIATDEQSTREAMIYLLGKTLYDSIHELRKNERKD